MKNIAIFASGAGSNATKFVEYFKGHDNIRISLIVSNKSSAKVLEMATQNNIPTQVISRDYFYKSEKVIEDFAHYPIDFIVLAGFLWLIPEYLVKAFPNRIVNIHPALLPQYGGKGMYGRHVHDSVHKAQEKQSGMTIHFVNEKYDEGNIIFQATCNLTPEDTPQDIAQKVLQLEHQHYSTVVDRLLTNSISDPK